MSKAASDKTWSGVFPAVTTKFTADDRLDIAEMERCFALQLDAGVHGLIVCGSLGEASTLEPDEKIEVLKTALRVAKGRVPVLLTVVEGSTRARRKRWPQRGAKAGAAGFMVLPGVPYKSDAARDDGALPRGREGRRPAGHDLQQSRQLRRRHHAGDAGRACRRPALRRHQGIRPTTCAA